MKVLIDKSFEKDIQKIKDSAIRKRIANAIIGLQSADNIDQIKQLKKLKGATNHYRIRVGDHRLGIVLSKGTFIFVRCLHRKNLYRYFPR